MKSYAEFISVSVAYTNVSFSSFYRYQPSLDNGLTKLGYPLTGLFEKWHLKGNETSWTIILSLQTTSLSQWDKLAMKPNTIVHSVRRLTSMDLPSEVVVKRTFTQRQGRLWLRCPTPSVSWCRPGKSSRWCPSFCVAGHYKDKRSLYSKRYKVWSKTTWYSANNPK